MKRLLIFITSLVLGPILGCFLSGIWHTGANTFWKQLNYFPYPVENIITVRQHGTEILVETTQNRYYQIDYPCKENKICWTEQDGVPTNLDLDPFILYKISNNKCDNDNFVYPLFHKIKTCITLTDHAPDATWTTSIALTDNNKLWIWDSPWEDPYSILLKMFLSTITGGLIGYLAGILLAAYLPLNNKKKRKHK